MKGGSEEAVNLIVATWQQIESNFTLWSVMEKSCLKKVIMMEKGKTQGDHHVHNMLSTQK
jgi:hypothetical protein